MKTNSEYELAEDFTDIRNYYGNFNRWRCDPPEGMRHSELHDPIESQVFNYVQEPIWDHIVENS